MINDQLPTRKEYRKNNYIQWYSKYTDNSVNQQVSNRHHYKFWILITLCIGLIFTLLCGSEIANHFYMQHTVATHKGLLVSVQKPSSPIVFKNGQIIRLYPTVKYVSNVSGDVKKVTGPVTLQTPKSEHAGSQVHIKDTSAGISKITISDN